MEVESIVQQGEASEKKLPSLELKEPLILQLKEKDKCSKELKEKTKDATASRDDHIYRRSHTLVYLVRGIDQGRKAWHYVLLYEHKKDEFLAVTKSGTMTINVAQYGQIIASGWGESPPESVKRKIEEEYS